MGLSPLYVDKMLELIDAINRQGVTIVIRFAPRNPVV
ncbi:metal-dependent hydrolase [Burkholderia stagnalis]|nr:metal-dependent hydrolase [Burkholderia stagnalis]